MANKRKITKKSTAKKSTAKKSTAKKSTAKKSTAKKSTAKKSTAKKKTVSKLPKLNIGNRYIIPEVPTRSAKFTSSSKFSNLNKNQNEFLSSIEIQEPKKKSPRIFVFLLLVAIAISAAYSFSNKSEVLSSDTNQGAAEERASSPTPNISNSSSPAIKGSTTPSNSESFSLKYLYNSTGISINPNDAVNLGKVKTFELLVNYNNSEKITLGSYPGSVSSIQVNKSDTVGKSLFTSIATLTDGTKVTSEPLSIRGKFEKP